MSRSRVSPGWEPRPSLSGGGRRGRGKPSRPVGADRLRNRVSPGWEPRPSLSANLTEPEGPVRVAGVGAPAFVERRRIDDAEARIAGVAGVGAPAFVERPQPERTAASGVAGVGAPAFVERCRDRAGSVAGVGAPAFVERTWRTSSAPLELATCRRGGSPGLR